MVFVRAIKLLLSMNRKIKICDQQEITPGMCKGFDIALPGSDKVLEIFLVAPLADVSHGILENNLTEKQQTIALKQQVYCYKNECPHTLANLNWQKDIFLNLEKTHIQCSMHGALFRIEDGLCVWGPCKGMRLQAQTTLDLDDEGLFLIV